MRAPRRRGGLFAAYSLGAALVLTSLSPIGPAAADGATTSSATLPFANPSGNPLHPGPLALNDGRLVFSPNDPHFEADAKELIAELEAVRVNVQLADGSQPADPAATGEPGTTADPAAAGDPAASPQPAAASPVTRQPAAPVPDPLDFASQPEDPANYLIPPSADAYRQGDGYRIPRPTAGGPRAGAAVPGLEEFYGQQISWGPCAPFDPAGGSLYDIPGVECGYLIVPVDYAQPSGLTAAIGLLRVPARNQAARIGSVFMDPGGPGSSGMGLAASMARQGYAAALNENFDLIGFDPRGVASSLPMIRCKSSASFDAQREGSDELSAQELDRILEHNTNECYRHTGAAFGINGEQFIAQVGTVNVVRDLDIARAAVGDSDLNYLGYSYGTSIGYQYAMAFPDNIRAMVLDGVVNPFENNPDERDKYSEYVGGSADDADGDGTSQIEGFQATFEQFLKQCAASDGFDFRGQKLPCVFGTSGDVAEMLGQYQAISQRAWGGRTYETKEADAAQRRPVSFHDVTQGTILALYSEQFWPMLNAALHMLSQGDGTLIMALADEYYSRGADGRYKLTDSAFQTIWCTDAGVEGTNDPQELIEDQMKEYASAPFTDPGKNADGSQRGLEPKKDWCTFYRTQHTLPAGQSLQAMPNILYISTTYDSATPYEDGVVAAAASQGTLLTVAGASHTSFLGASQCTDEITLAYYNTLVVPKDVPGRQGIGTKDIHSKVITGDECQVHSFRPVPAVDPAEAGAGEMVTMKASGLVRNTGYLVNLPEGYSLAGSADGTVTSAVDGTAQIQLTVPAGAQPGTVEIGLVPADPAANDPTVKPIGQLTIRAAGQPSIAPPDANGGQNDPGAQGQDGQSQDGQNDQAQGGDLATTGGELPVLVGVIAVLLLAAGVTIVILRKRASAKNKE